MKFQPDTLDGVNNITRYDVDNLRVNADLHTKSVLVPWVGQAQRLGREPRGRADAGALRRDARARPRGRDLRQRRRS